MALLYALSASAQEVLPLYKVVPNAKPAPAAYTETNDKSIIAKVSNPTLTVYLPVQDKATGTGVVICPGGGYAVLASGHEGADVARALNEIGVAAFVLKYRLPSDAIMPDRSIGPLQDAQRALQMVREHAPAWKVNVNRVGIMGFSAGGHLASTAGTHFTKALIENPHHISLRPDFMVLLYPVTTMGPLTHQGSKQNLIGQNAPSAIVRLYSNEQQVTTQTPPTFLVHAQDDSVVPVQNSLQFYAAMVQAGVKGELHIYAKGGHGFGMNNATTADRWFERMQNWMQASGWLNIPVPNAK